MVLFIEKPEDNIFYTNIDLSFISSRLIDIITKENTWFSYLVLLEMHKCIINIC